MRLDGADHIPDSQDQIYALGHLHHISKLAVSDAYAAIASLKLPHPASVQFLGNALLKFAVANGNVPLVIHLVSNHRGANVQGKGGQTALHVAARYGNKEIVRILLENDAGVLSKDKGGWLPFHVAAYHGHADVLEMLLPSSLVW